MFHGIFYVIGDFKMLKKLLILFIITTVLPLAVRASDGYPVLPVRLEEKAKIMLDINDARATMLYEKVDVTENITAWMIGWFWSDYKIVAGITENEEIIYYNKAPLGEAPVYTEAIVSKEDALKSAVDFVAKLTDGMVVKLVSANAYTYRFAHYKNDIRIAGHDIEAVVDKGSGEVYYYKGIINTDADYVPVKQTISKRSAYNEYFNKIGMEIVYDVKYNDTMQTKYTAPSYIFPNPSEIAVDAETGEIRNLIRYDCNYYFNDEYYDYKYADDNNIKTNEVSFAETDYKSVKSEEEAIKRVSDVIYAFRNGYSFSAVKGIYSYYDEQGTREIKNVWRIDIVPVQCRDYSWRISAMYDRNDYEGLDGVDTKTEYSFARIYLSDDSNDIYSIDTVFSQGYNPVKPYAYSEEAGVPKRVYEFIDRAAENTNELNLFSMSDVNSYLQQYTFARYVNGARVIGEGAVMTYNKYTKDIINFEMNMSCKKFVPLENVLSNEEMKEKVKILAPLKLYYMDTNESMKEVMYNFDIKNAVFDPFTGNRMDADVKNHTIMSYSVNSGRYTVNGKEACSDMPLELNGAAYVPLRFTAENFGYTVQWEPEEIRMINNINEIRMAAGYDFAIINDERVNVIPLEIIDGVTYISVETFIKIFGIQAWRDAETEESILAN